MTNEKLSHMFQLVVINNDPDDIENILADTTIYRTLASAKAAAEDAVGMVKEDDADVLLFKKSEHAFLEAKVMDVVVYIKKLKVEG